MVSFTLLLVKVAMHLPPPESTLPPSPRAVTRGKFFLYFLLIVVLSGAVWFAKQPYVQATIVEWEQHTLWENVKRLAVGSDKSLQGEAEGRINILILGQGGPGHDGPFLTDTIVLASVAPSTKQIALLSLPRDLVVPVPGHGIKKINSVNALGESQRAGSGPELTTQALGQLLNLPIPYYVRLDFAGFSSIIDQLGGLPINVERGFEDANYPSGTSTTTVSFEPGWQIMSGEKALEYVRSRHGNNNENTDFARSRRQQQILLALKEKLLSPATLLNPSLALHLYRTLSSSLVTNLGAQEAIHLSDLLRAVDSSDVSNRVLDNTPGGLLRDAVGADGAYLLVPNVADYSELKTSAQNIFKQSATQKEAAKIIIENGTTVPGLAEVTAQSLRSQGFTVVAYQNATHADFTRTLLYDVSQNKPQTRQELEAILGVKALSLDKQNNQADFTIILGLDRLKL